MSSHVGRAPVRIDLSGGTIDLWPVYLTLPDAATAVTVNVALDLPATVRAARKRGPWVTLAHRDTGASVTFPRLPSLRAVADVECPPSLRLLLHAVAVMAPEGGVDVTASSTSPQGAGLGGSSALLACALATIAAATGRTIEREAVRRLAQDVETAIVRGPTGYQDYYPPLFGGCLAIAGRPGAIDVERLPIDLDALSRRLRLVYTGAPHHSGLTNWGVMRAYFDGEAATVAAMSEIADLSTRVAKALRAGDLDAALALVVAEGRVRLRLAPGVTTPAIEALDAAVRAAGALGTKVMGAGGGGCVLVVLRDDREPPGLAAALTTGGGRSVPLRLPAEGLVIREEEA